MNEHVPAVLNYLNVWRLRFCIWERCDKYAQSDFCPKVNSVLTSGV
jgi:hypothetical protein